jgi:hypothetical protein
MPYVSQKCGRPIPCHVHGRDFAVFTGKLLGMVIGQVSFWKNFGNIKKYDGKYGTLNYTQESFTPSLIKKMYDTNR